LVEKQNFLQSVIHEKKIENQIERKEPKSRGKREAESKG